MYCGWWSFWLRMTFLDAVPKPNTWAHCCVTRLQPDVIDLRHSFMWIFKMAYFWKQTMWCWKLLWGKREDFISFIAPVNYKSCRAMTVCNFWMQGRCRYGDKCWNEHPKGGGGGGGNYNHRPPQQSSRDGGGKGVTSLYPTGFQLHFPQRRRWSLGAEAN